MDIEKSLYKHLQEDPKLTRSTWGNLFPLTLPQGVKSGIVYQRISSPRTLTLDGRSEDCPRIQFSVYTPDYGESKSVAQELVAALDRFTGSLGGQVRAQVLRDDYRDTFEQETSLYRCDVDFFVLHKNK